MQHSAGTENKTLPKELFLKTLNLDLVWKHFNISLRFDIHCLYEVHKNSTFFFKNSFIFNLN